MPRFIELPARRLLIFVAIWAGLVVSWPAGASWKAPREALDRRLASADIYIHYTLDGKDAFAPDIPAGKQRETEAAARLSALVEQLAHADQIYREKLGLRRPFSSKRYATGQGIDIHILKLDGKSGSTGDELHRFDYRKFPSRQKVLTIALTHQWLPTGITPAHELFHAYQYGYTFFKNAWFLEGMARASESFIRMAPGKQSALPNNLPLLDELLGRSYSADGFWNRLLELCGPRFLHPLLVAFDHQDDIAARHRNIPSDAWPENAQWENANNAYLLEGLRETLTPTHCQAMPGNVETVRFKATIEAWIVREPRVLK